ncbi:hypothetical protein QWT69_13915 [Sporosarcina oncorhynchi]|uniref:Uncharacterized protein n=1 Tax=Sporosarcina oncorhynchi TaxID=3056444 RepID=A0ABZ0L3B2_9BACL|nr:hypothetical protein [Sporosarcina sp. T2O-4]WOV86955.1 hypothetical protein QWT69_13915 [Sporosarcina sp. T2O-4]
MGIMIYLDIMPHHIDEVEWAKVYDETMEVINHYRFVDNVFDKEAFDCNWAYLTRTKEREIPMANDETGWHTIGDERTLQLVESFVFIKNLNYYRRNSQKVDSDDDILFSLFHEYADVNDVLKQMRVRSKNVFDGKTQGGPIHIPLLGIACLIESRFPQYAIVRGNITIEQMEKAVEWINKILNNPISLTERTSNEKLLNRIQRKVHDEEAVLDALMYLTLSDRNMELGELVRAHFKPETIAAYNVRAFRQLEVGTVGFSSALFDYFNQGFLLEDACDICVIDPNGCNYDAVKFVKSILSMDWLMEENDHEHLISIKIYERKKYGMTFQEVVAVLQRKLGTLVDIETMASEIYKEKQATNKSLARFYADLKMDYEQTVEVKRDHYTIMDTADLILWKPGDTIHPNVLKGIVMVKEFIESTQERNKEFFEEFQCMTKRNMIKQLIHSNQFFYIHEDVWFEIIAHIDDQHLTNTFLGLLSIKAEEISINLLCKNIANNHELFKVYVV